VQGLNRLRKNARTEGTALQAAERCAVTETVRRRKEIAQDVSPGYAVAENAKSPGDDTKTCRPRGLVLCVNSAQISSGLFLPSCRTVCDGAFFRSLFSPSFGMGIGTTDACGGKAVVP